MQRSRRYWILYLDDVDLGYCLEAHRKPYAADPLGDKELDTVYLVFACDNDILGASFGDRGEFIPYSVLSSRVVYAA